MALSTVSSLDESFTSGVPFVSEEPAVAIPIEQEKAVEGAVTEPSGEPAEEKTAPGSEEEGRDVEMKSATVSEQGEPEDAKVDSLVKEVQEVGINKPDGEGEESDSGSEDEILQVHD